MERSLEERVWQRARSWCEYCLIPQAFDRATFEIDHIIARSHGGATEASNLALACFLCNSFKGTNLSGVDEKTNKIAALFNPRTQRWARHFRWEGANLVGKTSSGRATVAVLRINLEHRVLHRQALIAEGVFPSP